MNKQNFPISNTDRVVEIMLENPQGIATKDLMVRLNVNNPSSFNSTIKRARAKYPQHEIAFGEDNLWRATSKDTGTKSIEKDDKSNLIRPIEVDKREKILELLLQYPDGIHRDELVKKGKFKNIAHLYSTIYRVRLKYLDYKISNADGIYYCSQKKGRSFSASSPLKIAARFKPKNNESGAKDMETDFRFPSNLSERIKKLDPAVYQSDIKDILDFLKKGYFYIKTAENLIEACERNSILQKTYLPQPWRSDE